MDDFIIVGAGPPGSRFAYQAATAGYDVTLLEKGEVGKPLACSGHVSTDIWEYLPADAKDDLFQNQISGARFHVGGPDSTAYPFYKSETISHVIDRVGLDKRLARRAAAAGADLRDEHTVVDVDEQSDRVVVTATTPDGSKTTLTSRMVAGCDGPTSRVRQSVGLTAPAEQLHGVLAFSEEPDAGDRVDVHLTAPTFFAWRIPRGDAGVEYGLAAPPGAEVPQLFDELTTAYDVDPSRRCSGTIPIGPPDSVTTDRVFLLGDAAAQTKPFTGGGILYSMTAADIAASTIDPTAPSSLDRYETQWRDELATEIRLGSLIRRCYSLPEPVQRVGLRALDGEIGVHMDRPSSFFSRAQLRQLFS
ncbi:geranylgeranyl reductase family protein [Halorubrum coriense]|uniref:geranylgeranyl reductase family protein n=1 Tax=Halorubrum coriense TaxID=64713 RepID=UPI0006780D5D|nr:geranylgeranyl reductase family protein [Halorubrum coriense]